MKKTETEFGIEPESVNWQLPYMLKCHEYKNKFVFVVHNYECAYMASINNQRYAQNIQGGFTPLQIGKMGMKILNNTIDHNRGMRYLSAAALIDNKQLILSNWE